MILKNTPAMETDRLILRKFDGPDIDALFSIYSDEEVNTYLPWYPLKTLEEAKIFFRESYSEKYSKPQGYNYAVCMKTDNIPIGYINVSMDDGYDFGYGLSRQFWHQGIVTEAGEAVIQQLRKDGIPYITATHDVNNVRSGQVMKRLGMSYQYSYEEQWQPKDILVIFRMYQLNLDKDADRVYQKYWDQAEVRFVEKGV